MSKIKNNIASEALKLPTKSRAQLAEKLIYSLEEGTPVVNFAETGTGNLRPRLVVSGSQATKNEKVWARESLGRYETMASGKVRGKSASKVLREIRSKLN